jgi:hypothetical protein
MAISMLIPLAISLPYSVKYLFFIASGFLCFPFPLKIEARQLERMFILASVAQIVLFFLSRTQLRSLDIESFGSGSAADTHTLPAMFGILFGFFLVRRRLAMLFLCGLMILISGKRSVLAGSIFGMSGLAIDWAISSFAITESNFKARYILILPILVAGFVAAVMLPQIYIFISDEFSLNINVLTSGRYYGQQLAYDELWQQDIVDSIFGNGLGAADFYAIVGFEGGATLIHCDFLRIILDFGFISGIIFSIAYMSLIGRGRIGAYFVFWSAYMWLTENNVINVAIPLLIYFCQQAYFTEYHSQMRRSSGTKYWRNRSVALA